MEALADAAEKTEGALEQLLSLPLREDNPYVEEWKAKGGKVFGYTCSYVPEELLYAEGGPARILPIRMGAHGCENSEDADILMHRFSCSYVRSLLQLGIDGEYEFLDGVVLTSCCEQLRRSFEHWRDAVNPALLFMLSVPRSNEGENRLSWYRDELTGLLEEVAKRYGSLPSRSSLAKAIRLYNEYRRLTLDLYALRALESPKLTGVEATRIMQAGFNLPKETFNPMLRAALDELRARPGLENRRARLMLCGSYLDDPAFLELIESTGAVVVTDTLCTGRKYVEGLVDETLDPLDALAQRYLKKISCPRMLGGYDSRVEFTKKLAREADVDGIIFQRIAFCDSHSVENMMEGKELEAAGVPVLTLEREYQAADKGRLKTRVQAFLEKIGK